MYKIASMYGLSVNELKALNNLSSNLLTVGQKLKILEQGDISSNMYVVKYGDTLYSIAKKYGVSVDVLKQVNNKQSNLLSIGEVLEIPVVSVADYVNYIVKPGDTLYRIAKMYNTTVDAIVDLNNLNSNVLSIGMNLKIPR